MDDLGATASIVLITLIAYKLGLILIGVLASRFTRDETDFFLGGRKMGPWVAGLSYAASTSSAWVLLGYTGFVYDQGVSALWMVPGILGAYAVIWLFFGPRLRAESATDGHITSSDYIAARAGRWKGWVRVVCGLLVLFTFMVYIAAQFGAAAVAFESQFQLSHWEGVLLGAWVILIYALMGGFWAVSLTDTLQAAVMALISLVLPVLALMSAGGVSGVIETLSATMPPAYLDPMGGRGLFAFLGFAFGIASIGLGALGQPHLLARLMAVRDDNARVRGFTIAIGWGVIVHGGMAVLALSGRALVMDAPDGEALMYEVAGRVLPVVLAGIVIAAVLSAVMSTVDSLLIAASASAVNDLGLDKRFAGREMLVSRLTMATLCGLAVVLTLSLPASIFDRVLFSWSALGAAFGPVIVARVCGVEPRGLAILGAILTGFTLTVVFYVFGQLDGQAMGGIGAILSRLASVAGDPFERIFPWVIPLILVFFVRQPRSALS